MKPKNTEQLKGNIQEAARMMGTTYKNILINDHKPHKNDTKIDDTRHALMYCLVKITGLSRRQAGILLSRDPYTVTNALNKIDDERSVYRVNSHIGGRMQIIDKISYLFREPLYKKEEKICNYF